MTDPTILNARAMREYQAAADEQLNPPTGKLAVARGIMHGAVIALGLWIAGGVLWGVL